MGRGGELEGAGCGVASRERARVGGGWVARAWYDRRGGREGEWAGSGWSEAGARREVCGGRGEWCSGAGGGGRGCVWVGVRVGW